MGTMTLLSGIRSIVSTSFRSRCLITTRGNPINTLTSTFEVSDVPRAAEPLSEVPYHQAISQLLDQPLRQRKQRLHEQIDGFEHIRTVSPGDVEELLSDLKRQLAMLEATTTGSIQACSRYHGRLVANVLTHPFIVSLHRAFTQHRPLCLSPDMIWLLICQGVAHHVNLQAEKQRSRLVQHQRKMRIEVRRDDFIKGSPENPWDEVINEISLRVREHIGSAHDLFVPQFSTTGSTERIAAEIVLLDAMQSYFDYVLHTLCGIPAITLEGTAEDWQALADRAQGFAEFDLEWWLTPLQPILRELVVTASGSVRRTFWQSIYKFDSFSGGAAVTGWIAAFFPYFKDQQGNPTVKNPWLAEGGEKLKVLLAGEWDREQFDLGGPSPCAFPGGLARAPFAWNYLAEKFEMEFLGGFVGVAQDQATLALRPEIGWAIRQVIAA
jgi:hypothetical protein